MTSHSRVSLKNWSLLVILPVLAACAAIAPGMHMDTNAMPEQETPQVKATLQPITQQLVRQEKERRQQEASADISGLTAPSGTYRLAAGDILAIVVWNHPELAAAVMSMPATGIIGIDNASTSSLPAGFVVDQNGMLQFPFVGSMKAAGMTVDELRNQLTSQLARFIKQPDVTVRVQAYRSQRVYVTGEVKTPGLQSINDVPMTLPEALSRSGGTLPTADRGAIEVTRGGKTYHVNLPQLTARGIDPNSIILDNGDVVRVAPRDEGQVFVLGEVTVPRALPMKDGRLTLNDALGEAGGLSTITAGARHVYVVRSSPDMDPLVYHLDARSPVSFVLAENFELQRKDVVYVDAHPLANWNRVISLILPGALSAPIYNIGNR
ncbi:MAG TPA: polysaccharide biosynthesis/export family protein [Burkholderiaceae bacterium]|nr:polysaccharide biosynthesis/export family protein [Burkholderiaceae bacterium]